MHNLTQGDAPEIDLPFEVRLQKALLSAIRSGFITAAHDVSDGGLAVTLAEMAMFGKKGAKLSLKDLKGTPHEILFSEAQSGVVITVASNQLKTARKHFEQANIPLYELGVVEGNQLEINNWLRLDIAQAEYVYESVIPNAMKD
jgi:phosphoribosylformylglycinamidine synthase